MYKIGILVNSKLKIDSSFVFEGMVKSWQGIGRAIAVLRLACSTYTGGIPSDNLQVVVPLYGCIRVCAM